MSVLAASQAESDVVLADALAPACFEPGDGDPERGAGDVVEADFVEEVDRLWVAAVFATHAELETGTRGPASFGTDSYQFADTITIDRLERRDAEDALLQISREESGLHVVAGETPRRLGEIVGAEGEELSGFGNLVGRHAARGSSIIVPMRNSRFTPVSVRTSRAT